MSVYLPFRRDYSVQVVSVTETVFATNVTNHASTVPESNAGDLLLALVTIDGGTTVTTPDGWSLLYSEVNGTSVSCAAYTKKSSGGSSTTVDFVTSAGENVAVQMFLIRNWCGSLAGVQCATPVVVPSGATSTLPTLTPSFKEGNHLWLAVMHHSSSATISQQPSDYTDFLRTVSAATTAGAIVISTRRNKFDSTQSPGTYTLSGTGFAAIVNTICVSW